MEKYSLHEFKVLLMPKDEQYRDKWYYIIYTGDDEIESEEWFDFEQVARYAAIGHISLLENGGN